LDYAFLFMLRKGIATTTSYPYVGVMGTCRRVTNAFKIKTYASVFPTCTDLTTALTSQPISVSVDATNWAPYNSGVFNNCEIGLNHAVLLIGQTNTYWTIKNSWGTLWG
jgi:hypothetical protein